MFKALKKDQKFDGQRRREGERNSERAREREQDEVKDTKNNYKKITAHCMMKT